MYVLTAHYHDRDGSVHQHVEQSNTQAGAQHLIQTWLSSGITIQLDEANLMKHFQFVPFTRILDFTCREVENADS